MVQAWGAVAPTHLLLLLLLVALQAWEAQAAPWRARELAVPVGDGHQTSQPDLVREPQGDPTEVAGGDGYPASRLGARAEAQGDRMDVAPAPRLNPALELSWHPRGPQRAKYKASLGQSSQQSSEVLKEILGQLEKAAHEMDRETVEKEALEEGGSPSLPVSDGKTGAIQPTGVPGVDGRRSSNAVDPNDFQKYCIEGAVAVLGSVLFGMALCGVICLWRKRKRRLSAAS